MLAALGLRYGTEEATEFSEKVHKTVALNAYRSSIEMAKERGAFEVYDTEREKNNPFINRLREADPEMYEEMKKYGRRNIACLTIAPDRHHQPDDSNHLRYRARIPARVQAPPQSESPTIRTSMWTSSTKPEMPLKNISCSTPSS